MPLPWQKSKLIPSSAYQKEKKKKRLTGASLVATTYLSWQKAGQNIDTKAKCPTGTKRCIQMQIHFEILFFM